MRTALLIGTLTTLRDAAARPSRSASRPAISAAGWMTLIQYVYTVLSSIPGVLLIAAIGADDAGHHRHHPRSSTPPPRAPTRACCRCA
jgi:hypothetical protein